MRAQTCRVGSGIKVERRSLNLGQTDSSKGTAGKREVSTMVWSCEMILPIVGASGLKTNFGVLVRDGADEVLTRISVKVRSYRVTAWGDSQRKIFLSFLFFTLN